MARELSAVRIIMLHCELSYYLLNYHYFEFYYHLNYYDSS